MPEFHNNSSGSLRTSRTALNVDLPNREIPRQLSLFHLQYAQHIFHTDERVVLL